MASRNGILRLALGAGLTLLLSGCYALGARPYTAYGGAYHHAPHGHGHHRHGHHKQGAP